VNVTVTQNTNSYNAFSLPTEYSHRRVSVYGCTVRSPLTGCQVTSPPRDRFSRHSKWTDTFRTALVFDLLHICVFLFGHLLYMEPYCTWSHVWREISSLYVRSLLLVGTPICRHLYPPPNSPQIYKAMFEITLNSAEYISLRLVTDT